MNAHNIRIIIEGADLTGKTSITKTLEEEFNLSRVHVNSKDPNTFEFYKQTLLKTRVVFDRHFIGEMIYPEIYNRTGNLDEEKFKELLNIANRLEYRIFVFTANEEDLLKRLKTRGEEHKGVRDNLLKINEQFLDIAKKYNLTIVNTSMMSEEEIKEVFIDNINKGWW